MRILSFLLCLLWCNQLLGQTASPFAYYFTDSVEVKISEETSLLNPWAGGLNATQFNTMDLDGDGLEDLVLFDRTTSKFSTFLQKDKTYRYTPEYEVFFPVVDAWMILADFDGDGKKDLFVPINNGVKVFKNVSPSPGTIEWEVFKDPILTTSLAGNPINLKVDLTDIPAIRDVDNDGDLDILTFIPQVGGRVEFHKNLSQEKYGNSEQLEFEKATNYWGNFEECGDCETYIFNGEGACRNDGILHAGSAILATDLNGDQVTDLVIGEVSCNNLVYMENQGKPDVPLFDQANINFPAGQPVNFYIFPAAFHLDLDFDGVKDLLVAPNTFKNEALLMDFTNSNHLYKNQGSDEQPDFQLSQTNFLQDQMIEAGEDIRPAVADFDGDGDLDLFVSGKGQQQEGNQFYSTVQLYENTGDNEQPAFTLVNHDYLDLSFLQLKYLSVQFIDLNQDLVPDLVISGTKPQSNRASLWYVINTNTQGGTYQFDLEQRQEINLALRPDDHPYFFDVNKDGKADLLVGTYGGALKYYRNEGNDTFSLENNSLGGVKDDFYKKNLFVSVADLKKDGKPELILGRQILAEFQSEKRELGLVIVNDFQDHLDGEFPVTSHLVANSMKGEQVAHYFGRSVAPVALDNYLLVGTAGGGVHLLKSTTPIDGPNLGEQPNALIMPNPANERFGIITNREMKVAVYSVSGKLMLKNIRISSGTTVSITTHHWPSGLYIVHFYGEAGTFSKKVLVQH
ncbi:FG-GAP-like repeat-containing protein [Rapidithrix thailandica]